MKKVLLTLTFWLGIAIGAAQGAPIGLPTGPLFIQFQNFEQISPTAGSGTENAWGIVQVRQISTGIVIIPNSEIAGNVSFFDGTSATGPQVTGMFYGLNATTCTSTPLCSSGGLLDLYWDDPSGTIVTWDSAILTPALRTGVSTYTGITDGTFLARLAFASGADAANGGITLTGDVIPSSTGFSGVANGFLNVDVTAGGAWANTLNGDWFNTVFGTRDFKFKNSYIGPLASWTGANALGAFSTDPVQAFAVPEPGTVALVGLAMAIAGGLARRRRSGEGSAV